MQRRTVYRTAAVVALFGAVVGFACSEYGSEEEITPPARDSGAGDDALSDAGVVVPADASDGASASCAASCTGAGRSCNGETCVVTCAASLGCNGVVCPSGIPCVVDCVGVRGCEGASCGDASTCEFRCQAKDSCRITSCGKAESCSYDCTIDNACRQISCGTAKKCTVECATYACKDGITCPARNDSTCEVSCAVNGCSDSVDCCADAGCAVDGGGAVDIVTCP